MFVRSPDNYLLGKTASIHSRADLPILGQTAAQQASQPYGLQQVRAVPIRKDDEVHDIFSSFLKEAASKQSNGAAEADISRWSV